jgi:hypothetical protein
VVSADDMSADFSTQPLGANIGGPVAVGQPGVAWDIQPVVSLYGDFDPTYSYTVSIQIDPSSPDSGGPGWLTCSGGTTREMYGGTASFSGCRIDKAGEGYRLLATVAYTSEGRSSRPCPPPASRSASAAAALADRGRDPFTTQPLGANIGAPAVGARSRTWSVQPVVLRRRRARHGRHERHTSIILLSIEPGTPQTGGPGTLAARAVRAPRAQRRGPLLGLLDRYARTFYQLDATTYSTVRRSSSPTSASRSTSPAERRCPCEVHDRAARCEPQHDAVGVLRDAVVGPAGRVRRGLLRRVVASDYSTFVTLSIDRSSSRPAASLLREREHDPGVGGRRVQRLSDRGRR